MIPVLVFLAAKAVFAASVPFGSGNPDEIVAAIDNVVKSNKPDKNFLGSFSGVLNDAQTPILVKERLAWAAGQLKLTKFVPDLIKAARHPSLIVRSAAVDALVRIRAGSALPTLLEVAASDPTLRLRVRATHGAGLLRSSNAVQPLVNLSSDPREEVRAAAALAMAATHSKKNDFTEILAEMAADQSPYVQQRARLGLDYVRQNTEALRKHLSSGDADLRLFAGLYFQHHGDRSDLTPVKTRLKNEPDEDARHQMELAVRGINNRLERERKRREAARRAAEAKKQAASTTTANETKPAP